MDKQTLIHLGRYLNIYIEPFDSCDGTLSQTIVWLEANGCEVVKEVDWLLRQGVTCDCEVVTRLYLPARFGKEMEEL